MAIRRGRAHAPRRAHHVTVLLPGGAPSSSRHGGPAKLFGEVPRATAAGSPSVSLSRSHEVQILAPCIQYVAESRPAPLPPADRSRGRRPPRPLHGTFGLQAGGRIGHPPPQRDTNDPGSQCFPRDDGGRPGPARTAGPGRRAGPRHGGPPRLRPVSGPGLPSRRGARQAALTAPAHLIAFEVLDTADGPLLNEPYQARRALLEELFAEGCRPRRSWCVRPQPTGRPPRTGSARRGARSHRGRRSEGTVAEVPAGPPGHQGRVTR